MGWLRWFLDVKWMSAVECVEWSLMCFEIICVKLALFSTRRLTDGTFEKVLSRAVTVLDLHSEFVHLFESRSLVISPFNCFAL
ncbi:unnamed protein product [Litomosoides sigmodontis]|uniref:Uncharacterized protein n=1 Tax=Litomosoides sigmodontis TaxID=42156 RepID=A0A3P6S5Q8_LITSI|nr:unnamed protein product [Litomosoides sigmodontis]